MERRVRNYLLGAGLGFLATVVLLDRVIAELPLPDMPQNVKAPRRMLAQQEAMDPPPDVVFLGCSYASFGIDPETVEAVAADAGVPVRSLNMAAGGAMAFTNARMCRLILEQPHPPKVIYFELSPGLLNSRWPSLREGVRRLGGLYEAAVLWDARPASRSVATLSITFAGYHQWSDIRRIVACVRDGAPINRTKYRTTDLGWQEWLAGLTRRTDLVAMRAATRDVYWGDFQIDEFSIDAVREVWRLGVERGVIVRFFEMPMSSDWDQVCTPEIRRRYGEVMAQLRAEGMPEPWRAPADLVTDDDFFDPDHLTSWGAQKVSRAIGQDLAALLGAPQAPDGAYASANGP